MTRGEEQIPRFSRNDKDKKKTLDPRVRKDDR